MFKQKRVLVIVPKPFMQPVELSEILAKAFELACDRVIEDLVTYADHKPTENGRVDAEGYFLRASFRQHIPFDGFFLILAQRKSARHLRRLALEVLSIQYNQLAG